MKTALSAILLFLSIEAHAMLFEWSGTCSTAVLQTQDPNCTGVAHAVFTVSDDYVPGTPWFCDFGGPCIIQSIVYFDNTFTGTDGNPGPRYWPIGGNYPFGHGRFPSSPFDPGFIRFGLGDAIINAPFWSNVSSSGGLFGEDLTGAGVWLAGEFPARTGIGGRFSTAFSTAAIPEPGTLALAALFLVQIIRRARENRAGHHLCA